MPLHLLGKKSWNPYAPDAIAKVKADEEAAAVHELALDEQRDEYDALVRLARMRGESPPPKPTELVRLEEVDITSQTRKRSSDGLSKPDDRRKHRRLPGEDDTDRDLRLAKRRNDSAGGESEQRNRAEKRQREAPLIDRDGHIQLFAPDNERSSKRHKVEKNADAEAERKERERRFEDQYTMRFSNASGFQQDIKQGPWYVQDSADAAKPVGRNAFGREDERRHERDRARTTASDPMAAMKAAQSKLKTVQAEREHTRREREHDLQDLRDEQDRDERRHRRRRHRDETRRHREHNDPDVLEDFSLDAQPSASRERRRHSDSRHRHHRHSDRRRRHDAEVSQ